MVWGGSPPALRAPYNLLVPTYAYACKDCGHRFEINQAFTDDALTSCPECDGRLRKVFNSVGVVFKGSGFYRNDSRSTGTSSDSSKSTPSKSSDKSSDTSSSSDASKSASSTSGSSSSDSGSAA